MSVNSQSPKILAIDTALDTCSATLLLGENSFTNFKFAPKQQAKLILPTIKELLCNAKITLQELNLVAFGCGPANFTGTRIAAAITQGIALGANLPTMPISTLQALAQKAYRNFAIQNVIVCLDARMEEIYLGIYQLNSHNIMQAIIPDMLCSPKKIPSIDFEKYYGIGNGWELYKEILQQQLPVQPLQLEMNYNSSSEDIAILAKKYFATGKIFPPENALPIYLRGAGTWKKTTEQ